jgi:hypothetical protein
MNAKRSLYLLEGFLCVALLSLSCMLVSASTGLQIKNVSTQLKETRPPVGNKEIRVYDIAVVLYNNDSSISDTISVFFRDPEPGLNSSMQLLPLNATLGPKETKTFTFSDWPTTLSGNLLINFSFRPSSHFTIPTTQNTGYYLYSFTISTPKNTTSTPGFELLIVLSALTVLLLLRKIKT